MKTLILFLTLLIPSLAFAGPTVLQFTWDAQDSAEQITGFHLYMDTPANMVLDIPDPLAVSCSYEVADRLNHAFSLTAYRVETNPDTGELETVESGHSDYAVYAVKRTPLPKPVRFKLVTK